MSKVNFRTIAFATLLTLGMSASAQHHRSQQKSRQFLTEIISQTDDSNVTQAKQTKKSQSDITKEANKIVSDLLHYTSGRVGKETISGFAWEKEAKSADVEKGILTAIEQIDENNIDLVLKKLYYQQPNLNNKGKPQVSDLYVLYSRRQILVDNKTVYMHLCKTVQALAKEKGLNVDSILLKNDYFFNNVDTAYNYIKQQ